jgi:hypothetical protein
LPRKHQEKDGLVASENLKSPEISIEQRRAARKALYLYAKECAAENPNWAGEIVSSDEAIERFGVTNQQLNAWRRNQQIVCFGVRV